MKTLLVAINAKFIHSSLAAWYLKAACADKCGEVKVKEFTINDQTDSILASVYMEKPDVVAFSCYIWNIETVLKLSKTLKSLQPYLKIILGGPEVSFESDKLLKENLFIDYILSGEGESSLPSLLIRLKDNITSAEGIEGAAWRDCTGIHWDCRFALVSELNGLPSPYTQEMLKTMQNRIVYFEASRGCPFSCSYCISSTFEGVRSFSLERVKKELELFMEAGIPLVKFVDRTFNCNIRRAKDIFQFIIDKDRENVRQQGAATRFHFEVAADLFNNEILCILKEARPGLFQFEIGIQSTNPATLEAVDRKTSMDKALLNVGSLRKMGNIHLHVDLIAGLPFEDYSTFKTSFNQIMSLRPHQLQLGFLKLLKGSKIRTQAQKYGYVFRDFPPYEVLGNQFISFEEILELKEVEELIEKYYNSSRFEHSLEFVFKKLNLSPFDFFKEFYCFNSSRGYLERPAASRELYNIFLKFITERLLSIKNTELREKEENAIRINEILKYDFLSSDCSGNLPSGLKRSFPGNFKEACFEFLKDEINVRRYLPSYLGCPSKDIFKKVHFEPFQCEIPSGDFKHCVILFDYSEKHPLTGKYANFSIRF